MGAAAAAPISITFSGDLITFDRRRCGFALILLKKQDGVEKA
jgi:hypothetical protein